MITFTKEQLIARINQVTAINKYRIGRDPAADGLAMDNELFAIALASLVAKSSTDDVSDAELNAALLLHRLKVDGHSQLSDAFRAGFKYARRTAPPAPVSVPDAYIRDERGRMMLNGRPEPRIGYGGGWNAFRAAMLQGADGNSPVIPDGWVACSERMPDNDDFVYIWPRPDFGVELHVAQYGKFDRRDTGWYAQLYEQNFGIEYQPITVTHWMPLPAAPQQEVTP